ncbi:MAG: carboxypeptidase M32 [bacterium]
MQSKLEKLKELLGEVDDLNKSAAVLRWDQETYMPPSGTETRAGQLATLIKIAHTKFVSDEVGQLLEDLRQLTPDMDYDSDTASLIRVTFREYNKARKIPDALVAELARKAAIGNMIWKQAKEEKAFTKFRPILEELVLLTRQEAECLGYTEHIYDPLLDLYEPEMKMADVAAVFEALKTELVPLIQQISQQQDAIQDVVFQGNFDVDAQMKFGTAVVKRIGYDFSRGRKDVSAHPFTIAFSPDDVRITTHLKQDLFTAAFFSTVHEGGHALYEQGFAQTLVRTPLSGAASTAVHESQSRLWENVIGRSRAFWTYFLPVLRSFYPAQLVDATIEQVYQAVNVVRPGYIRTEADEVTYNLHIFLRFDLESALIAGEIEVKDLPELWNEKMKAYLGLTPPDDALGVLQDIHWSEAFFGYFPTYALGNILALQFYDCVMRDIPTLPEYIMRGDFSPLLEWLRKKIHIHGAKFTPQELVQRVTGEKLNATPYISYLRTKYRDLYKL